jgi:hypothetical protein
MQTKTVVLSLIAIALVVIVFILARDTQDQAIIDELVRQNSVRRRFPCRRPVLTSSPIYST